MSKDELIIFPVPSLISSLVAAENKKDTPLTRAEVEEIRDNAPCIAMPPDTAAAVEANRGYKDISLEHVWDDFQIMKTTWNEEAL